MFSMKAERKNTVENIFTELNAVHLKEGLALLSSLVFCKRLVKKACEGLPENVRSSSCSNSSSGRRIFYNIHLDE